MTRTPFTPPPHPDDINHLRFFRTSKDAFGHQFYPEKPNHDWLWGIALSIVAALFLAAWVAYRTS